MTAYVAAHPKDSLGVHGYDLAEFGLDAGPARGALLGLHRTLRDRPSPTVESERYVARGRRFVDRDPLLVRLAQQPEPQEPRERVTQEHEAAGRR